jgi:hypothetical protein
MTWQEWLAHSQFEWFKIKLWSSKFKIFLEIQAQFGSLDALV